MVKPDSPTLEFMRTQKRRISCGLWLASDIAAIGKGLVESDPSALLSLHSLTGAGAVTNLVASVAGLIGGEAADKFSFPVYMASALLYTASGVIHRQPGLIIVGGLYILGLPGQYGESINQWVKRPANKLMNYLRTNGQKVSRNLYNAAMLGWVVETVRIGLNVSHPALSPGVEHFMAKYSLIDGLRLATKPLEIWDGVATFGNLVLCFMGNMVNGLDSVEQKEEKRRQAAEGLKALDRPNQALNNARSGLE